MEAEADSYHELPVIVEQRKWSLIIPLFRVGYPATDLAASLKMFGKWIKRNTY